MAPPSIAGALAQIAAARAVADVALDRWSRAAAADALLADLRASLGHLGVSAEQVGRVASASGIERRAAATYDASPDALRRLRAAADAARAMIADGWQC